MQLLITLVVKTSSEHLKAIIPKNLHKMVTLKKALQIAVTFELDIPHNKRPSLLDFDPHVDTGTQQTYSSPRIILQRESQCSSKLNLYELMSAFRQRGLLKSGEGCELDWNTENVQ